jgi:hypothetical protein
VFYGSRTVGCFFDFSASIFECVASVLSGIANIFVWAGTHSVFYSVLPVGILLACRHDEQSEYDEKVTTDFHVDVLSELIEAKDSRL